MAKGGRSPLFIGLVVGSLLLVLVALLVAFGFQLLSFSRRIESRDAALMSAVRDNTSALGYLKQNTLLLANDSNAARQALSLPEREYPILKPAAPTEEGSAYTEDLFLSGFDALLEAHDQRLLAEQVSQLVASPALKRLAASQGLYEQQGENHTIRLTNSGRRYFTVAVDAPSRGIRITDALGEQLLSKGVDDRVSVFIQTRMPLLRRHFHDLDAALERFRNVGALPEVVAALGKSGLTLSKLVDTGTAYSFKVYRGERPVLSVSLEQTTMKVTVGAHRYPSVEAFASEFPKTLAAFAPEQAAQKRVAQARREIERLQNDRTFMAALRSRRIHFARNARQDIDYFYYDFTDAEGNRIGSFGVQKKLGTIYLMDGDDVPISALDTLSLEPDAGAKKKRDTNSSNLLNSRSSAGSDVSNTESAGGFDVLLCGAHQNETDTIVVVHATPGARKVVFISVPRDLYYKGQKINAVYERFGPEELTKEVADITGLPIHNYVVIDMYAFIDVVNILGGIDVDIKAPLVDPTYRVRTGGGWGTLSYSSGVHHLDGIEALRVARSRHTTSDFARAYRQQDILVAIRDKLAGRTKLDVAQLYRLVGVFLRYISTNLTPAEVVGAVLTYRNAQISGHYVIDTANVLYQTYANIYYLGESGKHLPHGYDKGAWIVLPRNDDWSLIRHYVKRVIGGETP